MHLKEIINEESIKKALVIVLEIQELVFLVKNKMGNFKIYSLKTNANKQWNKRYKNNQIFRKQRNFHERN